MDMKVVKSEKKLCPCCMEEHEVKTILMKEQATFKNSNLNMRHYTGIVMQQMSYIWMNGR